MSWALIDETDLRVHASKYVDDMKGRMRCEGHGCRAKVSHIRREVRDEQVTIKQNFKLWPKEEHAATCPYDTLAAVRGIAREADEGFFTIEKETKFKVWLSSLLERVPTPKKGSQAVNT
jgi:hypothetical protein